MTEADPRSDNKHHPWIGSQRDILDALLEGCQIIGRDWTYVYVNDAAARQGRRPKAQLLGRRMTDVYPGIENTFMFSILRKCMEDRIPRRMENEFSFPDGSKGWFDLRFEPVEEGVFILSIEITDRKKAEAQISHLNAILRGIRDVNQLITREKNKDRLLKKACELLVAARGFHSVCIGLLDGRQGKVLSYAGAGRKSEALKALLDRGEMPPCARRVMEGSKIEIRRNPAQACPGCPGMAIGGENQDRDVLAVRLEQDDRVYGFMVASVPAGMGADPEEQDLLREAAGDVAFALRGIEIEAQLLQSQKMEAVGRLAGGIAHDFNNMLSIILGYSDMLMKQVPEATPLHAKIGLIKDAALRSSVLTKQLLAFSRKQVLQPRVLNLNEVIVRMEVMIRRLVGENIDIVAKLSPDLHAVFFDPSQIEQVLMNLVVNARDAMPDGGKLTIETANAILDKAYTRNHVDVQPGPYVMLAVTDTGCGMDEATRSRLFEPFFTTKATGKGTGLGLSTVYGIVKQSNSHIYVYSEPGRGSCFKVYIPRAEKVANTAQPEDRVPDRITGAVTVLLVEDNEGVRDLINEVLVTSGYTVLAACDAEEARRLFDKNKGAVHLLLTDVVLPKISGRRLAEALVAEQPDLPVLYMSGYTDNAIVHHGVLDPGTAFIEKPISPNALLNKVQEVLAKGSSRRA